MLVNGRGGRSLVQQALLVLLNICQTHLRTDASISLRSSLLPLFHLLTNPKAVDWRRKKEIGKEVMDGRR